MKSLKFEWSFSCGGYYAVIGYRGAAIGHIEKVRVGRRKQWCLVSDNLSWWRPDCLRAVADFIDSLDAKAAPDSASHNTSSAPCPECGAMMREIVAYVSHQYCPCCDRVMPVTAHVD